MASLQLEVVGYDHPDAAALISEVQAEYVVRYGGIDESPVDVAQFAAPRGLFVVGYLDGVPAATGAWRSLDVGAVDGADDPAEIKRMYVTPWARGQGHARTVLAHLERTAAEAGHDVLVLETGTEQPEAIALYLSAGYAPVAGYGHYRDAPESRSFAKRLGRPGPLTPRD